MELIFILYGALFLIGVWYAFRSGQLHERARAERERKLRKIGNYLEGRSIYDNGSDN